MSFANIILPDFLIADLYKDNLVLTQQEKPLNLANKTVLATEGHLSNSKEAEPVNVKTQFLGGNKKNVSIILNDKDAVYLKDGWLLFLTNILNACKLTIDDVAIFNVNTTTVFYNDLLFVTQPKFIIIFDVESGKIKLPFIIPHYQLQAFNNISFLSAPSLGLMLGNTEEVKIEKTKLWVTLKKMFSI